MVCPCMLNKISSTGGNKKKSSSSSKKINVNSKQLQARNAYITYLKNRSLMMRLNKRK